MTKRAEKALEILRAGGYFRKQLETVRPGREMFHYRLRTAGGQVVRNFGFQTFAELDKAGMLQYRACEQSSVWAQEWTLSRAEALEAYEAARIKRIIEAARAAGVEELEC